MKNKLSAIESKIHYHFKDQKLLILSMTHSSFAYEIQSGEHQDNEVLEFLGDSVLGLVVADYLFTKYTGLSEGELSKLKAAVENTSSLSLFAKEIKLHQYLFLGKGEEKSGGRKKRTILAGAFEAIIAAIYLDGGIEEASRFITAHLETFFQKVDVNLFLINNYKSALQEYFQKEKSLEAPVYETIKSMGPAHKKKFTIEVFSEGKKLAKAIGNSIKDAEQKAAQRALKKLLGKKIKTLTSDTFMIKKDND